MLIAMVVSFFGIIGDLVESMLKRNLGIKDSGFFLPGHGGFLDRFDSFIFAVPFVYVVISWFNL
jgi:phosphatidate cytidylyltransferase